MRFFIALSMLCLALPAEAAVWSYDGDKTNQENWAFLSPEYTVCESGVAQSPVRIGETTEDALPALNIHYTEAAMHAGHNDYTIRVEASGEQTLMDNGQLYSLKYIVFHSPAEHIVKGQFQHMEIELFHQNAEGKMLALSVFVKPGLPNAGLQAIVEHMPSKAVKETNFPFNPAALLPDKRGYYSYTGSLTTPPCTEGVEWRILKEPIEASAEQLSKLAAQLGRNARMVQPIYMRVVKETQD